MRESSLNDHLRSTSKDSSNSMSFGGTSRKYSNIKSRLYQPTSAYKLKKEATLSEKNKNIERKKREKQKIPSKIKAIRAAQDIHNPELYQFDSKELSPSIPVKDYSKVKYPKKRSVNRFSTEVSSIVQSTRRKRKPRHDKVNYERSPLVPHHTKK